MGEPAAIERSERGPVTVESLATDLIALGVRPGSTILVHSSLRAMGWVCGGPVAVVLALEEVLTERGTLVMPTHSGGLSDPGRWHDPAVPVDWWAEIRRRMPAYDPDLTPTRSMGAVPECFRKQRGVLRSDHPQVSFSAWGEGAADVTAGHTLELRLGDGSPLARVYDRDGWVLLLGVGHDRNTSIHLAEYRTEWPGKRLVELHAPVLVDGRREWRSFEDIEIDDSDFPAIGEAFERDTGLVHRGEVGQAAALLMPQRALVDHASEWMLRSRSA